jgi:imidazolonepropionase-like amidohydrolase
LKLRYLLAAIVAAATFCAAQQPTTTYIRAGRLFDSTSDNYRENVVIVVEGERIKAVQPAVSAQIPSDAKVMEIS